MGRSERRLARSRTHEAEQRDVEVRFSVGPYRPELGLGLPSFHSRPPSLSLKYPGPNVRHVDSRCSIATTTRHMLTLQSGNPRSLCLRSLEFPKIQDAHRDEHAFPLGAQVPALAA